MNIEQAKSIPLADILDKLNCKPVRISGYDLYYLSPLRKEKTASFHVNAKKNVWFDHGIDVGGDTIKFVCLYLESIGEDHTVSDALRWLKNMMGFSPVIASVQKPDATPHDRKLIVTNVQDISHPALADYLESRGIPLSIAQQYYKQVDVYHKERQKSIFALGMKNEKGGYELRNKFYKGCAGPKDITFIRGTKPKPEGIHLFEGGPDFVSAIIRQNNGQRFENDSIVLHSLSNLKKATPFIKNYQYRTAFTWMDNDEAGKKATVSLDDFFKTEDNLTHSPMNKLYVPYKDVNAWHMAKMEL